MKSRLKIVGVCTILFLIIYGAVLLLGDPPNNQKKKPAPVKVEQKSPVKEDSVKTVVKKTTSSDSIPKVKVDTISKNVAVDSTESKGDRILDVFNSGWKKLAKASEYPLSQIKKGRQGSTNALGKDDISDIRTWRNANGSIVWEATHNWDEITPNHWYDPYASKGQERIMKRNDNSDSIIYFFQIPDSLYMVTFLSYDNQRKEIQFPQFDLYSKQVDHTGKETLVKVAEGLRGNDFSSPKFLNNSMAKQAWKNGKLYAKLTPLPKDKENIYPWQLINPEIVTAVPLKE